MHVQVTGDRGRRVGFVKVTRSLLFDAGDAARLTIADATELAYLLDTAAMQALHVAMSKALNKRRITITVREDDQSPEVTAAVLDIARSAIPTSYTPPERAERMAELRATVLRERARCGLPLEDPVL
jgi:hypothetical protein